MLLAVLGCLSREGCHGSYLLSKGEKCVKQKMVSDSGSAA